MWRARSFNKDECLPSSKNKMHSLRSEVAEEKDQARAKTVQEKVVKKAVASNSKVPANKADLKKDKIVGKAEAVRRWRRM